MFSANSGQLAETLHQEIPEGTSAEDYAEMLVKRVKINQLKEKREQLVGENAEYGCCAEDRGYETGVGPEYAAAQDE